ncbi:helix-turn-helix domain-containing protein [Elusimicrobiota bacterium]
MNVFKSARQSKNLSQRALARLSCIAFRSIQLIESGKHNWRLSSLECIARTLGYPANAVKRRAESLFFLPSDSVAVISDAISSEDESSWKIYLFNFIDAFRRTKNRIYIETPPIENTPLKIKAMLASVTEALCCEMKMDPPWWCNAIRPLSEPWFVSGIENLKAMATLESPVFFKKRNIFVLNNFLSRT